jgi:hypothetical protein
VHRADELGTSNRPSDYKDTIMDHRRIMDHRTPDQDLTPTEPQNSRFRSTSFIALGSAVPASAPALALTGSIALCALVAVLVVACIGLAALVI